MVRFSSLIEWSRCKTRHVCVSVPTGVELEHPRSNWAQHNSARAGFSSEGSEIVRLVSNCSFGSEGVTSGLQKPRRRLTDRFSLADVARDLLQVDMCWDGSIITHDQLKLPSNCNSFLQVFKLTIVCQEKFPRHHKVFRKLTLQEEDVDNSRFSTSNWCSTPVNFQRWIAAPQRSLNWKCYAFVV